MLKFLSKTFGFSWGEEGGGGGSRAPPSAHPPPPSPPLPLSQSHFGKITDLGPDYGLIDGHIYFGFDTVVGGGTLRVGQHAHVAATGTHLEGGWKADRVFLQTENWESEEDDEGEAKERVNKTPSVGGELSCTNEGNPVETPTLGFISDIQGDTITLNNQVSLKITPGCCDFSFVKGDWVSLCVNEAGKNIPEIISMEPLRKRKVQGNISFLRPKFGAVDGEIYFQHDIIRNGYIPRRDDLVVVTAIESNQSRFCWRALSLVPTSVDLQRRKIETRWQSSLSIQNNFQRNSFQQGISVTSPDFGIIGQNETKLLDIVIKNKSNQNRVLQGVKMEPSLRNQFLCSFLHLEPSSSLNFEMLLKPNESVTVTVHCTGRVLGKATKLIIIMFHGFHIFCQATVDVKTSEESLMKRNLLTESTEQFQKLKLSENNHNNSTVIPGPKPFKNCQRLPVPLPPFPVPIELRKCIKNNNEVLHNLPCLAELLNFENYSSKFHGLLYLEEIEKENELRRYDLNQALLNRRGEFLTLYLCSKEEDRLSLLIGDRVVVCYSDVINAPQYEGFIHEILGDEFLLKFHPSFHMDYSGEPVDVSFLLNRTPLRRAHQAVKLAPTLCAEFLFPKSINIKLPLIVTYERPSTCLHCKKERNELDFTMDEKSESSQHKMTSDEANKVDQSAKLSYSKKRRKSVVERLFQTSLNDEEQADVNCNCEEVHSFSIKRPSPHKNEIYVAAAKQEVDGRNRNETIVNKNCPVAKVESDCNKFLKREMPSDKTNNFITETVHRISSPSSNNSSVKNWKVHNIYGKICKCVCHNNSPTKLPLKKQTVLEWKHSLNKEQKSAVRYILAGIVRPLPYIIFGPPGTGKTLTVVEAILQIVRLCSDSRILVCCPSNSAADLIIERLHESNEIDLNTMVRLNAYHRLSSNIPDIIVPYSQSIENVSLVVRYRLIVCTCITAGSFLGIGLHQGHFSHIFIDEASQVTEPESLIPLLFACQDTQIVLAGDPEQLGPVLRSPLAITYGLQTSLLERLMQCHLYQKKTEYVNRSFFDPLLVTKLVNNYRSHPALLHVSSTLFYDSELVACAEARITSRFCHWNHLPRQGFPILFHGLWGEECREGHNPSWFNPPEVMQVLYYVRLLYESDVKSEHIGIITPYRKQVEKLKLMFASLVIEEPQIGSVEEFQGNEKPVIIISTVRSSHSHSPVLSNSKLGFLRNYRRFNVSITRSRSLLIVIGDPRVLIQDFHWKSLLTYCVNNGGYTGCDIHRLGETLPSES